MIEKLFIKNFIIIDELELDLNDGFNCFIGETGAGKSIIVDAISYLTGDRIDKNIHKDNNSNCILEAFFTLDENIKTILKEYEYNFDDYLIITRIINPNNKSIFKINSQTTTLNFLKKIFELRIDIHSQKENQYLLNKENHLKIIDAYLDDKKILIELKDSFNKLSNLIKHKEKLISTVYNKHELELMQLEIKEIEQCSLSNDEYNELLKKENDIKNFINNSSKINQAIDIFNRDGGVDELLYEVINNLKNNDELEEIYNKLNDHHYLIKDIFEQLKKYVNQFDIDENEIDFVQQRLFEYSKIKRRYGQNINYIQKYLMELKNKVNDYKNKEEVISKLDSEIIEERKIYESITQKLSQKRKSISKQIEQEVINNLIDLELKNANFIVDFKNKDFSENGIDEIEFFISLNKGKEVNSIIKVASGGELSRILLALKCVFSNKFKINTVIFDEIDVGVSGKASNCIGHKMAELSLNTQIISITHSAQVASYAKNCYLVSKKDVENKTTSTIKLIKDKDLINQLALISNANINKSSIEAAEIMYNEAQKFYEIK